WGLLEESGNVAVSGLGLIDLRSAAFRFQLQPDLYGVAHTLSCTEHHQLHDHDGVPAVEFADHGDGGVRGAARRPSMDTQLAAGDHGVRHGIHSATRHGV